MIRGIDHLVIISPNLDEAIEGARTAGFTVVPGGTHAGGLTHNALIGFRDGTYLELISPTGQVESDAHRWFPRLDAGGGLVDMCLLGSDLTTTVQELQAAGLDYSAAEQNGRARPDGLRLEWRGSFPPGAVGERGWPFLIEDVTPRADRVPQEPPYTEHPNGAIGIAGVTVLVNDLDASTTAFTHITGLQPTELRSPLDGARFATMLQFPDHWLMLTTPTAGDALHHLETFGQGPYAVTLQRTEGPLSPGAGEPIDPMLMGGARFELD